MSLQIFIKFRTDQISESSAEKNILVVAAACIKLLDRSFNFKQNFIYFQGEIFIFNAKCHMLINCDYHDSQPDSKNTSLYLYKVVRKEASLLIL